MTSAIFNTTISLKQLPLLWIIILVWIPSPILGYSTTNPAAQQQHHHLKDIPKKAYRQQTPHSSRHFLPSHPAYKKKKKLRNLLLFRTKASQKLRTNQRFMEGWYYRLTLPNYNTSFAFIFSIEDAGRIIPEGSKDLRLCGAQVMGPNDEYLVQATSDHTKFW